MPPLHHPWGSVIRGLAEEEEFADLVQCITAGLLFQQLALPSPLIHSAGHGL